MLRSWNASYATWASADGSVAWTAAGCNGVGTDRSGTAAASVTFAGASGSVTTPDLTALVQGWVDTPTSNQGLLLRPQGGAGVVNYTVASAQNATLAYDAENRLTGLTSGVTASYVYDGDGKRVKETISGVTRVFIGNYYEVDSGVVKKYYYAGSTRVAENRAGTLYYLLSDHLGSTAVTTDASGNRVTELRYYPYGGSRYNPGGQITTYRFTGQRWDAGTAIYFYNARWYDPAIGRFLSPDTIVPSPGDPQSLNRYSYVFGNPLKYTDPTGHNAACAPLMGGGPLGVLAALGCEVGYAVASYGPQLIQLATNLSQFASSPQGQVALQQAQQLNAAANQAASKASSGGNAANSGGMGPNDPWDKFNRLLGQGKSEIDAAVEASTQGSGDRFVIGPYNTPAGALNYIKETTQNGGKYFDAGNKLWDQLASASSWAGQLHSALAWVQMWLRWERLLPGNTCLGCKGVQSLALPAVP